MNKKENKIPNKIWLLLCYEGFERFSYYGLRTILILYMTASFTDGGLGLEKTHAIKLMANYSTAVLGSSLLLGFISDLIGARISILIGSIIATLGHLAYHFHSYNGLITGMVLLAFATGLIKLSLANVLTLYVTDKTRIIAFKRLYTLINIGAFIGQILCSYTRVISYQLTFKILLTGMISGLILVSIFILSSLKSPVQKSIEKTCPNEPFEKRKLSLLGISCLALLFYFSIMSLEDSIITLWIENYSDHLIFGYKVPSTLVKSLNPLLVITMTIPFLALLQKLKEKFLKYDALQLMVGIIIGLSCILPILIIQYEFSNYGKVKYIWGIIHTALLTFAEMSIIPVLLSLIPLTVPKRHRGSAMGVYSGAGAIGAHLSGIFSVWSIKSSNFIIALLPALGVGSILILLLIIFCKELQPAFETKDDKN